jgi:hypothetical protein
MNAKIKSFLVMMLLVFTMLTTIGIAENKTQSNNLMMNKIENSDCFHLKQTGTLDDELDQQQPSDCGYGQAGWDGVMFAQTFIPTLDSLTRIELKLLKKGNPESLTISIKEELDGNDLCSLTVNSEEIISSTHWHEFDLDDIQLEPGVTYYIIWLQNGGDGDNCIYWGFGENDQYPSGEAWKYVNNQWSIFDPQNQDEVDFCFKTYGKVKNPSTPSTPTGSEEGDVGELLTYSTSSTDPGNGQLYYQWDWGDGNKSEWDGPYNSGETINAEYSWDNEGIFIVKVKAKNVDNFESEWSNPIIVGIPVKNEDIDQTQDSNSGNGQGGWSGTQLAQKFIPVENTLTKIDLLIFRKGDPQGLNISIRKELNEKDIISQYSQITELDEELKAEWITFNFEDIDLISGESYYIVWEQDGGDTNNVFYWTFGVDNPYIYGEPWVNAGSWIEFEPPEHDQPDFCFKTYHAKDKFIGNSLLMFLEDYPILFNLFELLFRSIF